MNGCNLVLNAFGCGQILYLWLCSGLVCGLVPYLQDGYCVWSLKVVVWSCIYMNVFANFRGDGVS